MDYVHTFLRINSGNDRWAVESTYRDVDSEDSERSHVCITNTIRQMLVGRNANWGSQTVPEPLSSKGISSHHHVMSLLMLRRTSLFKVHCEFGVLICESRKKEDSLKNPICRSSKKILNCICHSDPKMILFYPVLPEVPGNS